MPTTEQELRHFTEFARKRLSTGETRLGLAKSHGEADENSELNADVKQALFKTRRGRIYRILFLMESSDVYILRVRGPGQAPNDEIDLD